MEKFCITVRDSATYLVEADTLEEAKEQAWEWFSERIPEIIEEKDDFLDC